jgi:formyltetrahydrofolate deformylase
LTRCVRSGLLAANQLNIFLRMQFQAKGGSTLSTLEDIKAAFAKLMQELDPQAEWQLHPAKEKPRVLVMVSKIGHVLNDILHKAANSQLPIEIPLIVSNHPDMKPLADLHKIPYHHIPVTKETKAEAEAQVFELMRQHSIDLVCMARYMQVLSAHFCDTSVPIINIHHSSLPSFVGAKPYHQAYSKGVKLIGATGQSTASK